MIRGRPTSDEVAPLILAVYTSPGGGAGCCLHAVLDDGNWNSVDWCLEHYARPEGCATCIAAGEALLRMKPTGRYRAWAKAVRMEAALRNPHPSAP